MFRYEQEEVNIGIAGGGRSSVLALGALDVLFEERQIKAVSYSGASIGSVEAVLLAVGKTPRQVASFLSAFGPWFSEFRRGKKVIQEFVDVELGKMRFANLPMDCIVSVCPIFDATFPEEITRENSGDLTVGEVVAASCSLPFYYPSTVLELQGRKARVWDGGLIRNPPIHPRLKNVVFSYQYSSMGNWNKRRQFVEDSADWLFKPDINHGVFVESPQDVLDTYLAGKEAMQEWLAEGRWA